MACKPVCKLCDRLVISQAVTFTGGNLVINLPAGSYRNHEKYCIVVAQSIPNTTTINAPVFVTIGTGGTFKLLGSACPCPTNNLPSINGTAPAAPAAPGA